MVVVFLILAMRKIESKIFGYLMKGFASTELSHP